MAMVRMRDNVEAQPPLELAVFCKRQWPRLVATLTFLVRDTRTAEDLAQEAMTRVCQHWKTVARMEYPGVWVHRVAVNLAHTHNRREATRRKATTAFPEQDTAQSAQRPSVLDKPDTPWHAPDHPLTRVIRRPSNQLAHGGSIVGRNLGRQGPRAAVEDVDAVQRERSLLSSRRISR